MRTLEPIYVRCTNHVKVSLLLVGNSFDLKVDSASASIRFVRFSSSSLDLEVFSYVTVTDVGEYLEVAEDLNLRLMDIVAAAGSSPGG